jgi:hypothetical protein
MAAIFAMTEPDAKDMPMDPEQAKAFEKMFQDAIQNQTYAGDK